ncbi:MAG: hypothetical protein ACD_58C00258G0002 [uncultured bacterium]|nr:MAG: hypothetical protein ACD_58C00258G0002 [uncultured bacterium]
MNKTHLALVAGALAVLFTAGGLALADDNTNPRTKVLDEAVSSSIISQDQADKLKDLQQKNFETKRAEMRQARQEMMKQRLDQAVKDGTITQEEADQITSWQNSRPAALDKIKGPGKGMHRAMVGVDES